MARFRAKKSWGNYKTASCPFCGKISTQTTEQGLNVCRNHTNQKLEEIRCTCGSWLEQRSGKFGPYFNCLKCGNISYNKGMEIKSMTTVTFAKELKEIESKPIQKNSYENRYAHLKEKKEPTKRKEITISSNDVEYFD